MDKAQEKIDALGGTEELNKIAQALYPIVRINREQDGDLLMFAFTLRQLFKALGYHKLPEGKPPLLSDERILKNIENNNELLEIGRKAIEDVLIEWRDGRLSEFTRGNGLVIREKDGRDSYIIRFGPETALKIGLKAIGQALKERAGAES